MAVHSLQNGLQSKPDELQSKLEWETRSNCNCTVTVTQKAESSGNTEYGRNTEQSEKSGSIAQGTFIKSGHRQSVTQYTCIHDPLLFLWIIGFMIFGQFNQMILALSTTLILFLFGIVRCGGTTRRRHRRRWRSRFQQNGSGISQIHRRNLLSSRHRHNKPSVYALIPCNERHRVYYMVFIMSDINEMGK